MRSYSDELDELAHVEHMLFPDAVNYLPVLHLGQDMHKPIIVEFPVLEQADDLPDVDVLDVVNPAAQS